MPWAVVIVLFFITEAVVTSILALLNKSITDIASISSLPSAIATKAFFCDAKHYLLNILARKYIKNTLTFLITEEEDRENRDNIFLYSNYSSQANLIFQNSLFISKIFILIVYWTIEVIICP